MLTINGRHQSLEGADPAQSLAAFCRDAGEQSVRVGCGSGACGACTVAAIAPGGQEVRTINACLAPVGSLSGYQIVTASGLGNSKQGVHAVQERIGAFHASQCGFCTPGIAAALGAALSRAEAAGRQPDAAELARSVDGNLCRCTGYRPIMAVCKSFACGGGDMEDLGLHSMLDPAAPTGCSLLLASPTPDRAGNGNGGQAPNRLESGGRTWLLPTSLQELLEVCASAAAPPRFLAGNTGAGLYKELWPSEDPLVVGLGRVQELRTITATESHLLVGAAATISDLVSALEAQAAAASKASNAAAKAAGAKGADQMVTSAGPLGALAAMLARIAGAHVRQAGSVGGNLVLARCRGLESDLATALLGWGATAVLLDVTAAAAGKSGANGNGANGNGANGNGANGNGANGSTNWAQHTTEVPLEAFLQGGRALPSGQLLLALKLELPAPGDFFWCHKVAPAYSSVHATMNASIKLTAASKDGGAGNGSSQAASATVVFGFKGQDGWVAKRASAAEAALSGADLSADTLAAALRAVVSDVSCAQHAQQAAAMAQGLLLQALGPLARKQCAASGGCPARLDRLLQVPPTGLPPPVMSGKQEFEAPPADMAPLGAPLEKDRVLLQASGEAQYTADVPLPAGSLHAAWVTSEQACATIESIDASPALQEPGVVSFLSAADLPDGRNSLAGMMPFPPEPLFASGEVLFHSQPLGVIVATTQAAARRAAKLVRVQYGPPPREPVFSIEQAREHSSFYAIPGAFGGGAKTYGDPSGALEAAEKRITGGTVRVPAQYHLYLEPMAATALPDEGGTMKIYSTAQSVDFVQKAVAHAMGVRLHSVEAVCRRVGGGFGAKATRNLPTAVASAVAAHHTGKAVQFVQDRATDMRLNGGRCEVLAEYDAGFTSEGAIQALSLRVFLLLGAYPDVPMDALLLSHIITLGYDIPNLSLDIKLCRANLPPCTFMRAPGDAQAAFIMESVIEAVALACGLDSTTVRDRNLVKPPAEGEEVVRLSMDKEIPASEFTLPLLWERLKASCAYQQRAAEVAAFNARSPWIKRGLAMTHTRFDTGVRPTPSYVSIFADGSVVAFGGGAELGQGLTTKVKQVVLWELSKLLPEESRPIPPDLVRMGDQSTNILPGGSMTGGSTTSEAACHGVKQACEVLVQRLRPFADKLAPGASWADLMAEVAKAQGMMSSCKIPLTAYGHTGELEGGAGFEYTIWGVACSEAEVNVLTGERQILRTDILQDCGRTLNPAIDIGQVEGAFAQGLGMALSEARAVDPASGRLLNDSLWDYHPPLSSSMPRQLNVALLPGSRLQRSALSAKAVGEPPLMLATSALAALQAAVRAARAELAGQVAPSAGSGAAAAAANGDAANGSSSPDDVAALLRLPASVESVVAAVGAGRTQGPLPDLLAGAGGMADQHEI